MIAVRGITSLVTEYQSRTTTIAGHLVGVISYRLGDKCVCCIDNARQGMTICRTTGKSRRDAIANALEIAIEHIKNHPFLEPELQVEPTTLHSILRVEPPHTYTVEEFLRLSIAERMDLILSGNLAYRDEQGLPIPAGDAMRLLKEASTACSMQSD